MHGSYLLVTGDTFNVDAFLKHSSLAPEFVYHRGQRTGFKDRTFKFTGFSSTVSEVFGKLTPQIAAAIRFFHKHKREIARLSRYSGIEEKRLILTYCPGTSANVCEYIPPELLALAGSTGIGIQLSVYPGETDDGDPRVERWIGKRIGHKRKRKTVRRSVLRLRGKEKKESEKGNG